MNERSKAVRHSEYLKYKADGRAYEWARQSRERLRPSINDKQRAKRANERERLMCRMECDARRTLGVSPKKLTQYQVRVLFAVRLFKLMQCGKVAVEESTKLIADFETKQMDTLLELYKHRVKPNILKGTGYGNVRR